MKLKQRTIGVIAGLTATAVCATGATAVAATNDHGRTGSVAAAAATPKVDRDQDGKAVFKGLFFGQGKVGAELAKSPLFSDIRKQMAKNNPEDTEKISKAIVDSMNAKYPGFFADFSKKTRSGDPRKVETAVNAAQTKLLTVVKTSDKSAQSVSAGQMCGTVVAVAGALVHIGAAVTAAAAVVTVTVAVGANFVKGKNWFWSVAPDGEKTALGHDMAVASVTKILKAA
ncbi:sporulation delaying protein family toxin [Streptomyces olivoreticuli]